MRVSIAVIVFALVSAVAPSAAASKADQQMYTAKCKAASFARRGPGVLSSAMRNAEIQRCINNKGFLD